ncbi:MAG: nicotinate-nucleotide adenylyltransferase [Bacteroidetes bacterium]|nr:MAG: nicotinate-nucleotide adenylyltransferase [Bacteroidota bacterium]
MNIGLFFGSFNPIHIGHLIIANYMIEFTEIEEVWFVVSPQNPFKIHDKLEDEEHRLAMARLAVEDNPHLKISDVEFKLSKPSFTLNTLHHLYNAFPEHEFKLIMGADNLAGFHKWKGYEEILKRHELFVYHREGFDHAQLKMHPKVRVFDAPVLNISATFIREVLQAGKSIHYLVPTPVEQYIHQQKLY